MIRTTVTMIPDASCRIESTGTRASILRIWRLMTRKNGMVRNAPSIPRISPTRCSCTSPAYAAATCPAESAGEISGMNPPNSPHPPKSSTTKAGPHQAQKTWIRRCRRISAGWASPGARFVDIRSQRLPMKLWEAPSGEGAPISFASSWLAGLFSFMGASDGRRPTSIIRLPARCMRIDRRSAAQTS